ncbi:hypothetical protein F4804DRAFT_354121 [Jackrogersella minutella]|nr:hypothetical protein F4804DRAFT_354121 [Jackrogersella minutella]
MPRSPWNPQVYLDFIKAAFEVGKLTSEQLDRIVEKLRKIGHPITRQALRQHVQKMNRKDKAKTASATTATDHLSTKSANTGPAPSTIVGNPNSAAVPGSLGAESHPTAVRYFRRVAKKNMVRPLDKEVKHGSEPPKKKRRIRKNSGDFLDEIDRWLDHNSY